MIVLIFFIVYQQLENHVLQPVVYGRTVQLSPLVVLIAVLIGAELAGVIGALAAIPVAGTVQVLTSRLVATPAEPAGRAGGVDAACLTVPHSDDQPRRLRVR